MSNAVEETVLILKAPNMETAEFANGGNPDEVAHNEQPQSRSTLCAS